jgi:acetyl-CoA carboxylase carboxyl transferase subunit beta
VAGSADITVAESGATVAFAGPRVAARFLGRPRDPATNTAEAAFKNGLVDMVLSPEQIRDYVSRALKTLASDEPETVEPPPSPTDRAIDAWEAVTAARAPDRYRAPDLTVAISEASVQLRGDRAGGQDPAIVSSIERIAGRRAVVLAMDRKFVPGPAAYRKARRSLDIAARLDLPVVTIVDTRGADPSETSESAGLPWEISATFTAMLEVPVPTLCIVSGEGGSGGALALATTDVLVAYEDSIFSVIGPDLAAEILWRDASREREAAELLKLTGADLVRLGIADELVAAPLDGPSLRRTVAYHLGHLAHRTGSPEELLRQRRERWRRSDFGD